MRPNRRAFSYAAIPMSDLVEPRVERPFEPSTVSVAESPQWVPAEPTPNLVESFWRYRWAVALPGALGAVIGFLFYLQTPETFRSTTRLMVEADRSPALDAVTGELVGGVPGIEIVESQLISDHVVTTAFNDARMIPFHDRFPNGVQEFRKFVIGDEALKLTPEFTDAKTYRSLVMLLNFDSESPELSEAAVKSFSDALQEFYNRKHKSSKSELLKYMVDFTERLYPEMRTLEKRYRDFRKDAPLQWDAAGAAINPHRDQQIFLVTRRSQLMEELRTKQTELAAVEAVSNQTEDPQVALAVVGQLLERRFTLPDLKLSGVGFGSDDEKLALVKMEQELVPLLVERNQNSSQFGEEHPTVRQLDLQIEGLREELTRLAREQTGRISELLDHNQQSSKDAAEALDAVRSGLSTQVSMLRTQIDELNKQIATEGEEVARLADYEYDHESMIRDMEQHRTLMDQVDEQMTRVSLTEEESGTRVIELTAPSIAYLVSPVLWKNLAIGCFLGVMLGGGLAFLLEQNANTFRDPDQIASVVGAPVLTHLPFFKGRSRKRNTDGESENRFEELEDHLVAVHSPASVAAEAIRTCRTSIFFETSGLEDGKVIQVTSPLPGDGKSTIAGNLACSIAQSGKPTVVVDCDLRRPQLTDNFAAGDKLGLTDALDGRCEYLDAVHDTPIHTLKVMPSGPIPANPAEALTLPEMGELLDVLRQRFDYVIVDSPPLLLVTDPSILASYCEGVILAVKVRRKSKPNTREATKILQGVGSRILGVVVNNSDEPGKSDGYRGHGYYRYARQASRYRTNYGSYRNSRYYSRQYKKKNLQRIVSGRSGDLAGTTNFEPSRNGHSSDNGHAKEEET